MNYNGVKEKLNDIYVENNIWIIYIIIIIASWYANSLEKQYFLVNDIHCKNKYRQIMIKIFLILIVVYYYFLKSSLEDYHNLTPKDSTNKKKLTELSVIGSLLIFVSGLVFLYIAYRDQSIDVEIAFN